MSGEYIQAYICPVCHDDHSWGPHRFSNDELAARDAAIRAEAIAPIQALADAHLIDHSTHFGSEFCDGTPSWDSELARDLGLLLARIAEGRA